MTAEHAPKAAELRKATERARTGESAAPGARSPTSLPPTFRSLANRNYRLLFFGGLVSNVGTWMSRVAQDWLVLVDLTPHSARDLGLVTGLQFLPWLLLAPWAGLLVDRYPKRRILAWTQVAMLLTCLLQAVLVLTGQVRLWQVFALAGLQGIATAVDAPARNTFVSDIVGPDLVSNAVGLNSASFNAARLIGPGVSGAVIAWAGTTGWVFLANAVSFVAVLIALGRMDVAGAVAAGTARGKGRIREGLRYVRHRPDIMILLSVVFLLGTFGLNFQMTTALMATTVYHKGPGEYGLLGSIMAVGSLGAALLAARRPTPRLRTIVAALALFTVSSASAALAPSYEVFAVLLVPVGLSALTVLPSANSLVQLGTDPQMRGRVMALYLAVMMGGTPIGAPLIGWVGSVWGARWTILVGSIATAIACIGATIVHMRTNRLRVRFRRGARPPLVLVPKVDPSTQVTEVNDR